MGHTAEIVLIQINRVTDQKETIPPERWNFQIRKTMTRGEPNLVSSQLCIKSMEGISRLLLSPRLRENRHNYRIFLTIWNQWNSVWATGMFESLQKYLLSS